MGRGGTGTVTGRCGQHSNRRKTLAWCGAGQLVLTLAVEVPGENVGNKWCEPVDFAGDQKV